MTRKYVFLLTLLVVVVMATNASAQYSRIKNIVASNHNLSATTGPNTHAGQKAVSFDQICYFCHVPHQMKNTTDPVVVNEPNGQTPLWNHYLSSTASYGVYSSPSFDPLGTDIADLGGAVSGSAAISNLCLSCHDGTVGINTLYKGQYKSTGRVSPDFGGGPNVPSYLYASSRVGDDALRLRDEHPLNFTYNSALAAKSVSLVTPSANGSGIGGARLGVTTSSSKFLPLFSDASGNPRMQCSTCHDVHDNSTNRPFLRASTTQSELCLACHGK